MEGLDLERSQDYSGSAPSRGLIVASHSWPISARVSRKCCCWAGVSAVQRAAGTMGPSSVVVGGMRSLGVDSLAGMAHFLKYIQQVLDAFEAERCATQAAWVEFQIGSRDRHQALDVRAQPDHTTATEVRLIRYSDERQGAPA